MTTAGRCRVHLLPLTVLISLSVCGVSVAAEPQGSLAVVYDRQNDVLSVEAHEVSLGRVLHEVSSKTSVTIDSQNKELLRERVSVAIQRLPLERALSQLLAGYNSASSYASAPPEQVKASSSNLRVDKVLVLSKKQAASGDEALAATGPGSRPATGHHAGLGAPAQSRSADAASTVRALKESGVSGDRDRAVADLLGLVAARDAAARQEAMMALTDLAPERAVQPLMDILQDRSEDPQSRMRAAALLGQIGDPKAVDVLIRVFGDGERNVQQAAAGGLARIGGDRSVQFLLRVFSTNDRQLHQTVATALAFHGDDHAKAALAQAISQSQVPANVETGRALV